MLRATMALLSMTALTGSLGGCLGGAGALAACDPRSTESAICNLTNPEDLGFLPDRSWIIVSEMAPNEPGSVEKPEVAEGDEVTQGADREAGTSGGQPTRGRLSAIRLSDFYLKSLYPIDSLEPTEPTEPTEATTPVEPTAPTRIIESRQAPTPEWGDEDCPGEPDPSIFRPHGIDVGRGPHGRSAIAVVNHGGREAVEFFEILEGDAPSLVWRGCVLMPVGISANDVAFLPSGGFVVTNFMPAFEGTGPKAIWTMLKISFGARTGSVLRWTPGGSIEEIENSEGSAPNGIVVSADGNEIYVAEWGGESVYRLRLSDHGSPLRDGVELDHNPDNMTWMRDGRLLVAGQLGGVSAALSCASVENAGCDIGYSVYAVVPVDHGEEGGLEATKLFEDRGAASVALEVGEEIFVGFFIGDQIERVRMSDMMSAN
jgi:hypothetical protein